MKSIKRNLITVFACAVTLAPMAASALDNSLDFANHPITEGFERVQNKTTGVLWAAALKAGFNRNQIPAATAGKEEFEPELPSKTPQQVRTLRTRLTEFSRAARSTQIDVTGCKRLNQRPIKASCYGLGDGFAGGPIERNMRFNPSDMTVAFPDRSLLNAILVVRNPHNDVAKKVVVTDIGPSRSMQAKGRGVDLSVAAMSSLGVRCPSVMDIEIYNCAARDHQWRNAKTAETSTGGGGGGTRSAR